MLFLRTPGSKDLLNFVKRKGKLARRGGLDHFGFKITKPGLRRLERKLKDNNVAITGRRGEYAIYVRDPNGYAIEYYCD
jgi:catechol-2,3-dioxygenase